MYHVSIYFDKKTEARMRDYIKKVAEVRIGLAKMNPHREIASWELKNVNK